MFLYPFGIIRNQYIKSFAVAESWDNSGQFGTNLQWFKPPINAAFMQRQSFLRFR
jgi:hypothetical protein